MNEIAPKFQRGDQEIDGGNLRREAINRRKN